MAASESFQHILLAIKRPHAPASAALAKAAALAHAFHATLELFHGIDLPLYSDSYVGTGRELSDDRRDIRADYLQALEVLAAPLREQGLAVCVSSEWDFPSYESVLRRAQHCRADLIVCEHHTGGARPWPLHAADWQLLRRSPVPLLLVRSAHRYAHAHVLAAIDPLHAHAKPAVLDGEILRIAQRLCAALDGSLHVLHASEPGASAPAVRSAIEALVGELPRAPDSVLVRRQPPVPAISEAVRELRTAILVMGAISRSGLERLLIGNTAERLIDSVACDVLVLKPPDFGIRFPERARGADLRSLPLPTMPAY